MLMIPKEAINKVISGPLEYSKREIFTLSDGGTIAIDYMGGIF